MQSLRCLIAIGVSSVVAIMGVLLTEQCVRAEEQSSKTEVGQTPTKPAPASVTQPANPVPFIPTVPGVPPANNPGAPATIPTSEGNRVATPDLDPNSNPLQFPTKPEEVRIQGVQPITLQQAWELARRNNRALQVIRLQLESSQAALREAEAAQLPTLSTQVGITNQKSTSSSFSRAQSNSLGISSSSSGSSSSSTTPLSGTIQLSYTLDTAGQIGARIRAAERQVRFNELEFERQSEELRLSVATDYYALQQADEQVRISQAAVNNAQISLRDAQALERAGVGTRFDVLRAEVQLANANQDLTRAISQQRSSQRQLAQRLSIPQTADLSAGEPVQVAGTWNLPLEESIVLAYKNRAELEQQLVQREISDEQRQVALSALNPQLNLVASYSVLNILDSNPNPGFVDGYSIGAQLNWTLFDGGAAIARAEQQEKNKEIAETRFADNRNQIRLQVEQSYFNLQSNAANIQTTLTALGQAEEALRLARLRFQAGVGTQADVISAETDLTRAEVNRLQAILDYNRALASIVRAVSNVPATPTVSATPAPAPVTPTPQP